MSVSPLMIGKFHQNLSALKVHSFVTVRREDTIDQYLMTDLPKLSKNGSLITNFGKEVEHT